MKDWTGNAKLVFVCNGASNHTEDERQVDDYYATEPKATQLLLDRETFSSAIWECACGGGHMSEVLKENGYEECFVEKNNEILRVVLPESEKSHETAVKVIGLIDLICDEDVLIEVSFE